MTRASVRRPVGFDYAFHPASYFEDLDPTTVSSSILGEEQRKSALERN